MNQYKDLNEMKTQLTELLESPTLALPSLDSDCEAERKAIVKKIKKVIKQLESEQLT